MQNETPPPFVPFAPNFQPPKAESPPLKPEKPSRKKREKKTTAPVGEGRTTAEAKQPRQRRPRAAKTKPSRKYDLQTILKIAGTLKESDQTTFEKLLGDLSALAKGSRERVLKALVEVFG